MQLTRRYDLKIMRDTETVETLLTDAGYRQVKLAIIKEMENYRKELTEAFLMLFSEGTLYESLSYNYCRYKFYTDSTDGHRAFEFFLDTSFILGEWIETGRTPKKLIDELAAEIRQDIKPKARKQITLF